MESEAGELLGSTISACTAPYCTTASKCLIQGFLHTVCLACCHKHACLSVSIHQSHPEACHPSVRRTVSLLVSPFVHLYLPGSVKPRVCRITMSAISSLAVSPAMSLLVCVALGSSLPHQCCPVSPQSGHRTALLRGLRDAAPSCPSKLCTHMAGRVEESRGTLPRRLMISMNHRSTGRQKSVTTKAIHRSTVGTDIQGVR